MFEGRQIAIVIPAYCEAERIGDVIRALPAWVDHIVVVDDASRDDTAARAQQAGDARLVLLRHSHNQGVGAATRTGFDRAVELGAELLVKMDGDGQMDPAGLPALLGPIVRGQADMTKGNRFAHTRALGQMPWVRRVGNIGLSFLTKVASGYWNIFDPTNGYVALHASVWQLLDRERLHPRFFFESSLLLQLGLIRAVVRDVSLPARYHGKVSHLSETRSLVEFPPRLLRGLARRVWMQYFVHDFTAVSLFLVSGMASVLFGAGWGAWHWWLSAQTGRVATTGTVMIAVLSLMLGVQLLLQAVVLDIENVPREPVQRHD